MDAARYGTIWELSVRGHRAPETRDLKPQETQHFGPVTLRRYQQQAAVVLFDVLASARLARSSRGPVRVRLQEVGFEPHRCIMVTPPPDGTVNVSFENVPRGREIVGYVGLADVFTRRDVRDPGRLELHVDGAEAARVTVGVDDGWVRFSAPIGEGSGPAVLEFRLTAVGPKATKRQICFAAEVRQ
jgi:hypothetical protein